MNTGIKCFVCHEIAEYICEGYSFCYVHAKEFSMGYGKSLDTMIIENAKKHLVVKVGD